MMKIRLLTVILLIGVLINSLFFVSKVSAEDVEEAIVTTETEEEVTEEEVEKEVVTEVIQVIEYVEPEEVTEDEVVLTYPERHLSGTSSVVEDAMVESLRSRYMDWFNSLADGFYDYALMYNYHENYYHLAVLNDDAFAKGLGFWYAIATNSAPGIEGIRTRKVDGSFANENPATFYFDGDTGEMTSASVPGNSYNVNLTHFGSSYMVATTLPYGKTGAYGNADITIPPTNIVGHEWTPFLEHSTVRREGGGLYDVQKIAILLFFAFVGWFVGHFAFGYFAPQS